MSLSSSIEERDQKDATTQVSDDDDMYCHEEERIEFEGIQCEDKGVNTEIQMKDEAMNTDVELKDKGVNTQEDHCYCRRYVQEESEHSSVIIECAEHRHFTQHVQVEEKAINTDAGMDSRFLSTSSPFEMLKEYHLELDVVSDCPSVGVMTVTMLTECANVSDIRYEFSLVSMVFGV
ncbi:hypothetical protein EMCRGX_G005569 [Ephydatia muelleri]